MYRRMFFLLALIIAASIGSIDPAAAKCGGQYYEVLEKFGEGYATFRRNHCWKGINDKTSPTLKSVEEVYRWREEQFWQNDSKGSKIVVGLMLLGLLGLVGILAFRIVRSYR